MNESKSTQCILVLEYMEKHGAITPLDAAIDLGIQRLGARIYDLRKRGWVINDEWAVVLNRRGKKCRVKKYSLGGDTNGEETRGDDLLRDGEGHQGA